MPIYRFRVKGNGRASVLKYTDGMNVEIVIPKNCGFWDSRAKDSFIKKFTSTYNIQGSATSAVSMLFKKNRLDVQ